jgi:hypothetical protein
MSEMAFAMASAGAADNSEAGAPRAGERVGPLRVTACGRGQVELHVAGDLGVGRAIVGIVPIVWCLAAWTVCLREQLLAERLNGCMALTLMAAVSAALMASSLGTAWRFDGRRRRVRRRAGVLGGWLSPRRCAAVKVETSRASAGADVRLRLTLTDASGREQFEVASWPRRDVDRGQVEALAGTIRNLMGWEELSN